MAIVTDVSGKGRRRLGLWLVAFVLVAAACGESNPTSSVPSAASAVAASSASPSAEPTPTPEATLSPYDDLWEDATADTIGATTGWTNKVEIADVNGDGLPDLLFANGGAYETSGPPEASQVFLNRGSGAPFEDATEATFGDFKGLTRVIKVRDLNADSIPDIILGTTFQTQSQLFLGTGDGAYELATNRLPQGKLSVGDLEIGDVDADGDLDIALADWSPGSPMESDGGRVQLWLNDGSGTFTDATAAAMPDLLIRFSWDLELLDIDNDWDLDLAISSKRSVTSFLFTNDGSGTFADATADHLPHFTNNYEFEPMDLDGDGYLELLTINDGANSGRGGREHVFRNDGSGSYVDATPDWWPNPDNPGEDDNVVSFLDVDSDGDADFIIGALTGPDRLMINDGSGHLSLQSGSFNVGNSEGTLGMAVADLNGDGRLDVVDAQGENPAATEERVYLATDRVALDTAGPVIRADMVAGDGGAVSVYARITDGISPYSPNQFERIELRWAEAAAPVQLEWYGEYLFRGISAAPGGAAGLEVCAVDRAGNETCVEPQAR